MDATTKKKPEFLDRTLTTLHAGLELVPTGRLVASKLSTVKGVLEVKCHMQQKLQVLYMKCLLLILFCLIKTLQNIFYYMFFKRLGSKKEHVLWCSPKTWKG